MIVMVADKRCLFCIYLMVFAVVVGAIETRLEFAQSWKLISMVVRTLKGAAPTKERNHGR